MYSTEISNQSLVCSNLQIRLEGETQYVKTFIDKNGNKYTTNDSEVNKLGFKELIEKYSRGDLDDKIELLTSYDSSLIEENYKKLREVALNEDVSIQYPELYPDVQSEELNWYGMQLFKELYGAKDIAQGHQVLQNIFMEVQDQL